MIFNAMNFICNILVYRHLVTKKKRKCYSRFCRQIILIQIEKPWEPGYSSLAF